MSTDRYPLMRCGHVAQGRNTKTGKPVCVICSGITPLAEEPVEDVPDISGRIAECALCGAITNSSYDLASFEYRGPGSYSACEICICGYSRSAHKRRVDGPCNKFTPRGPFETDLYYCGCRGWD